MSQSQINYATVEMSDEEKERIAQRDNSIRRLATRLGVEPVGEQRAAPMVGFMLTDGTQFALEDFLFAHLDAMDEALTGLSARNGTVLR